MLKRNWKFSKKRRSCKIPSRKKANLRQQQMKAKQGYDVQRAYLELKLSGMSKDLQQTEQQLKEYQETEKIRKRERERMVEMVGGKYPQE